MILDVNLIGRDFNRVPFLLTLPKIFDNLNLGENMEERDVVHASDLSFSDIVLTYPDFVLVDFYLASLPDCQRQGVVIEDLASKYKGKVKMVKLDTDKNPGISSRYRVTSTPTLILFKDGEEIDRMIGFVSEGELRNYLDKILKKTTKK